MKPFKLILCTAAVSSCIAAGCGGLDDDKPHKSKNEAFSDRFGHINRRTDTLHRGTHGADTLVYIAGVEFDDGYDWKQDSLYGTVEGRILLLKNGTRVLSIDAGPGTHASTDPDRHHLLEGHLFTEFTDSRRTYIGKDGKELFSYEGKEYLCGLVLNGKDLYTLGQDKDGRGFSLRCNGKILFSNAEGCIAGHMGDSPDYPNGALYNDSGHLYFCYRRPLTSGSSSKAWFIVEDGTETQVYTETDGLYDIRVKDGEIVKTRIASGYARTFEYHEGPHSAKVTLYDDGSLFIYGSSSFSSRIMSGPHYFFSSKNACLSGTDFYVAATPAKEGARPFLWKNGAETEIEVNGFVSEVEVSVLPRKDS